MSDRVLVLNADEDECQAMSNLLRQEGFHPIAVHRLENLRDRLQKTNCIVAILDIDSIHLNNRTVQGLRLEFPEVYFLCTSKDRLHPELKDAIYYHIYACLNKPVDPDELFYWLKCIIKNKTEFQSPTIGEAFKQKKWRKNGKEQKRP